MCPVFNRLSNEGIVPIADSVGRRYPRLGVGEGEAAATLENLKMLKSRGKSQDVIENKGQEKLGCTKTRDVVENKRVTRRTRDVNENK